MTNTHTPGLRETPELLNRLIEAGVIEPQMAEPMPELDNFTL